MSNKRPGQDRWEGFQAHPEMDPEFRKKQKEGFFGRNTQQAGPPRANLKKVPFDQWDWKRNDPGFFEQFSRIPQSKDPEQYEQIKWRRWNIATRDQSKNIRDFGPKTFMWKMKFEIALVSIGVVLAFMMPSIRRNQQAERAGPQDAQTQKYMRKQAEQKMADQQIEEGHPGDQHQYLKRNQAGGMAGYLGKNGNLPFNKYDTQKHAMDNEPDVHVFNFNPTGGYSDNMKAVDDSENYNDRKAFGAEVESLQNNYMKQNQQNARFNNSNGTNPRMPHQGGTDMGSGGLYNRKPRQRYTTPNVDPDAEEETSSHNGHKAFGTDWKIR